MQKRQRSRRNGKGGGSMSGSERRGRQGGGLELAGQLEPECGWISGWLTEDFHRQDRVANDAMPSVRRSFGRSLVERNTNLFPTFYIEIDLRRYLAQLASNMIKIIKDAEMNATLQFPIIFLIMNS